MESIQNSLTAMADMFNARMNEFQQELSKTSSPVTTTSLAAEFSTFRTFMMASMTTLQRQVEFLGREIDRMEMKNRRKMILLHGIPEDKSEDTSARVTTLVADYLDLPNFSSSSIKFSHRLGRPSGTRNRPIVVKFSDIVVRDKVWFAKTRFKGTGITQSEFLTKTRHDVFLTARQRFGIGKCWTREGRIFIIAPDGSRHQVETSSDLEAIPHSLLKTSSITLEAASRPADNKATVPRSKRITRK